MECNKSHSMIATVWLCFLSLFTFCFVDGFTLSLESKNISAEGRIIGGDATTIAEFPYQVSLHKYGSFSCGGAVIAENIVLTSAHCVYQDDRRFIKLRIGSSYNDKGGKVMAIKKIIVHEDYKKPKMFDNDIAILVLKEKLHFNENIAPIPLPDRNNEERDSDPAIVSGWGRTSEEGYISDRLNFAVVQLYTHQTCKEFYKSSMYTVTETMICAGVPEGGKSSCQGDSGGPLVSNGKLVGLVSWGKGCGRKGFPIANSRISYLRDWIDKNMAGK